MATPTPLNQEIKNELKRKKKKKIKWNIDDKIYSGVHETSRNFCSVCNEELDARIGTLKRYQRDHRPTTIIRFRRNCRNMR